jgi:hypothetical protein
MNDLLNLDKLDILRYQVPKTINNNSVEDNQGWGTQKGCPH